MVPFYITIVIQFHIRKGGNAMGTIIGEGITFDDVLLVPAYSKVIPKTDVEYEYLFINGDFDIDMIMSKTKRKKVKSFKLSEADLAAPLDSHRMDYYNGNQNMKVLDFSSGNPEHKRFGVITRLDGNLCKIILEPDEALAQAMKNSAPSKVFLD